MQVALRQFLCAASRRGFVWGEHDCMLFAADWARARTGHDPASAWRGSYASEAAAEAILEREGGLSLLMRKALAPCGWQPVVGAAKGDIAVVQAPTRAGRKLVAAVCVNEGRFAFLTLRGLAMAQAPLLIGWHHG